MTTGKVARPAPRRLPAHPPTLAAAAQAVADDIEDGRFRLLVQMVASRAELSEIASRTGFAPWQAARLAVAATVHVVAKRRRTRW